MLETSEIVDLRKDRNKVRPDRPYHFMHEQEPGPHGRLNEVNTVFLTNSECPFKCVMCDLWKNTLKRPVQEGDIPKQISYALERLPSANVIKLYNNGNFFDHKAIPPADYPNIAELLADYDRVIIENHPKLCNDSSLVFKNMLSGKLEIALGLETIHPEVLPKLNKKITAENFREAVTFLSNNGICSRAFILLNPPYLTDSSENTEWSLRSIRFAFQCGVTACSIIPTRDGNGAMEKLRDNGLYVPPTLKALEETFDRALKLKRGYMYVDLWDLKRFSECDHCFPERKERLHKMNLEQVIHPHIKCDHCEND
jgi:hypothetical protein